MWGRLGLRGRMALSYLVTSIVIVLAGGFVLALNTSSPDAPGRLARQVHATAADYAVRLAAQQGASSPTIRPFPIGQTDGRPNAYGIVRTADQQRIVVPAIPSSQRLDGRWAVAALAVNADGTVVSSSYPVAFPPGAALGRLVPESGRSVARLRRGGGAADGRAHLDGGHQVLWTLYPVRSAAGIAGAAYVQAPTPDPQIVLGIAQAPYLPLVAGFTALVTAVVLGPVGALFGVLTMHGTVRRLRRLVEASRALAAGDFSRRVQPRGSDEVAELQRQFNSMAAHLEEAVGEQERLSAQNARLAERGRIARELHDAMSQDLFSLRMRLAALEQRQAGDSELRRHLGGLGTTAGDVIRQMRALLLELRPPAIGGLDLETGIHEGEAAEGAAAVDLAARLAPDVVLLDLVMPGRDGVTTVRELRSRAPSARVVVLTSYHDDDLIYRVVWAGALSYLLKDVEAAELLRAVRAAARGESILHPRVAARLLGGLRGDEGIEALTPRELEVLMQVARGQSNRAIAAGLFISEETVKTHVSNLLSKLQVEDRTQAAIYALRRRLVPLDDAG